MTGVEEDKVGEIKEGITILLWGHAAFIEAKMKKNKNTAKRHSKGEKSIVNVKDWRWFTDFKPA